MEQEQGKFQCVVIAPAGTMLDSPAYSVVIPAHDGLRGIMYNHLPMFCALGLGIMEIRKEKPELKEVQRPSFFLIDGGFALLAANHLSICAYDAVSIEGLSEDEVNLIRQRFAKRLARKDISKEERSRQAQRAQFLDKLIDLNKAS